MVVLGLLLMIVAIVAAVAAALRGDMSVHVDLRWFDVDTNAAGIFFAGAATMLVFVVGWWMLAHGLRRSRERRREVKGLRRRAAASEKAAQREHEARIDERTRPDANERPEGGDGRVVRQREGEGAHAGHSGTRRDS